MTIRCVLPICATLLLLPSCVTDNSESSVGHSGRSDTDPLDAAGVISDVEEMPSTDMGREVMSDVRPVVDADHMQTDAVLDAGTPHTPDLALVTDTGVRESDMSSAPEGRSQTSCGAIDQGLTPVDCTAGGDVHAQCVFSNHCFCSDGFICASGPDVPGVQECAPGDICVPPPPAGTRPTDCGSLENGVDPVDCTRHGDVDAVCVFGDHCLCSERFFCQGEVQAQEQRECRPSTSCIPFDRGPAGSTRYSCGANGQGLEPVDCTQLGDFGAVCIFSNHCGCSDGFVCEGQNEEGACMPGQRCQARPQ